MGKFLDEDEIDKGSFTESSGDYSKDDDWADELRLKLEEAVEVWIASAYMDFRGVELLRKTIKSLPQGSSREFRILLDDEFHGNELVRQVIINQLYQLPNTVIRIANTKGKFHPKCYVFNNGSVTSCLVGSMNMTGAAISTNVEFGICIDQNDESNILKCREFFLSYWNKAKPAIKTELLEFTDSKFRILDRVKCGIDDLIGIVTDVHYDAEKKRYRYKVFFSNNNIRIMDESDLSKLTITEPSLYEISRYRDAKTKGSFSKTIYHYLYSRYLLPAEEGLYNSIEWRIYETWYQKIPLLKIMSSERPRLLIADEVGLGKTIEAGLIITEMLSKMLLCRRILILCPNNLLTKWEAEMRVRFGLYFDIYKGADAIRFMRGWRNEDSFFAIMSYETLRKKEIASIIKERNTGIDILVCDEAHNLRNDSIQQRSVRGIAQNNRCMLMLTATPINLSNQDLKVLLHLLDPDTYKHLDTENWVRFRTPNVFISQLCGAIVEALDSTTSNIIEINDNIIARVMAVKNCVIDTVQFGVNYPVDHPLVGAVNEILAIKEGSKITTTDILRLMVSIQSANVFARSVTRTMKKDVGEFHVRDVKSIKVTLKYDDERLLFQKIQDEIKAYYKKNRHNKLVAHSYLRQASSCLPVFNSINKMDALRDEDTDADPLGGIKQDEPENRDKDIRLLGDSKYECLKKIIDDAKNTDGEDTKIVVFCIFRKTISYLLRRILADYGPESAEALSGIITDQRDRDKIIRKFREETRPNILICSEIASEGIDLQTSRILVNYDLPWNPTRVEQRIGRIDRFGQKSETVYIFNLVVEGTIEEIIYGRLGKRLEDTRNTLGPVAEILGELEKKLPEYFLQNEMSEKSREKYLNRLKISIDRAKQEESKMESRGLNLSGRGLKYLNQKYEISHYLVDHHEKIARYIIDLEKSTFKLVREGVDEKLRIDRTKKGMLLQMIKAYLIKKNQKKRYDYLANIIKAESFEIVLDHESAMKKSGEYLNINHPMIKVLIKDNGNKLNKDCLYSFESISSELESGIYFILEYKASVTIGKARQDSCFFEAAFVLRDNKLEFVETPGLKERLYDFTFWRESDCVEIPTSAVQEAEEEARKRAKNHFEDQYEKMKNMVLEEYNLKKEILKKMVSREYATIQERINSTPDPQKKAKYQEAIVNLNSEIDQQLKDIPGEADILFSPDILFCAKIIRR
jgi:ATP-dependent helicase HepA